jgi:hypothetical protein
VLLWEEVTIVLEELIPFFQGLNERIPRFAQGEPVLPVLVGVELDP